MVDHFIILQSIVFTLIVLLIVWIGLALFRNVSSEFDLSNNETNDLISGESIAICNYFMPQRVPCFIFNGECNKLVGLLDELPIVKTKEMKNSLVVRALTSLNLEKFNKELNEMTNFELECLHCVNSWLLHLIYFELSIYHAKLKWIAYSVGKLLHASFGGSSNVSFTYNWQHVTLKPNSFYDARTLTDENIVRRFRMFSNEESDSLWYFIKGHILMEARASNIFDDIIKLYTIDQDGSLVLLRETLSSICYEMKTILTIISSYMHKNKVLLKHWPTIQQLLQLPTYDGMSGLQNCWIFAMNFIVNVKQSNDEEINRLEQSVWKYLLPYQRDWMLKFKQHSEYLMLLCKSYDDDELFLLFEKLIAHVITWRAIHRSRASQFISSALTTTYKSTSGRQLKLSDIQRQWDQRIKDFSDLKQTLRTTNFLCKFIRGVRQRERTRLSENISRRLSLQYENIEQEQYRKHRTRACTLMSSTEYNKNVN
jgi:hypothetical protein